MARGAAGEDGSIRELDGRVTTLLPGASCLLCRGRILRPDWPPSRSTPTSAGAALARATCRDSASATPSVGTFTTLVTCFAINEVARSPVRLQRRLRRFGATELLLRLHERRLNFNSRQPGVHWCGNAAPLRTRRRLDAVSDGLIDWWRRRRWTKPRIKQVVLYATRAEVLSRCAGRRSRWSDRTSSRNGRSSSARAVTGDTS